jgi:mannosyl-3-phosphoglycerate phosphatase
MKPLLVVTDLDGSLLDEMTYDHRPATEALLRLEAAGVPLVLASSKTRAEMEAVARTLPGAPPAALIVENGGAVVRGDGRGPRGLARLGASHRHLQAALEAIGREVRTRLVGFSSLLPAELRRLTGLSTEEAARGKQREFDEPFLLEDEAALPEVEAAASRHGLRLQRGGRFHHLTGATDKGRAFRVLVGMLAAEGASFHTVGLGDAANDLPLLEAVDEPILMPRPGGRVDETLRAALPEAACAPAVGPAGWNATVLEVLDRHGARAAAPGP